MLTGRPGGAGGRDAEILQIIAVAVVGFDVRGRRLTPGGNRFVTR
jgi:hypothetical protein